MPSGATLRVGACGVLLLVAGISAWAQPVPVASTGRETAPFEGGTVGVELAVGGLVEVVTVNHRREQIADARLAMWWAFADGRWLVVEVNAAVVFQPAPRNAFVQGVSPVLRWRLLRRPRWTMFAEAGAGVSWSDTAVPVHGTRFNYLGQIGLGFTRAITSHVHALAAIRGLHVSNADRDGSIRNPDIEALGGYVGLSMGF
jgi:hypothetical protein